MKFKNQVILQGVVLYVSGAKDKDISSAIIVTKDRNDNYPEVVFFGDNSKKIRDFKSGDLIKVTGAMKNYKKKKVSEDGKEITVFRQGIVAKSLERVESVEEEAFGTNRKGRVFDCQNQVIVSGTIGSIKPLKENVSKINVYCFMDGKPVTLSFVDFVDADKLVNMYEKGTFVNLIARVQADRPEKGKEKRWESLVVLSMNKADESAE